jgi:hypothetical protein
LGCHRRVTEVAPRGEQVVSLAVQRNLVGPVSTTLAEGPDMVELEESGLSAAAALADEGAAPIITAPHLSTDRRRDVPRALGPDLRLVVDLRLGLGGCRRGQRLVVVGLVDRRRGGPRARPPLQQRRVQHVEGPLDAAVRQSSLVSPPGTA